MSNSTTSGNKPPTGTGQDDAKPPHSTQLTFSQHLAIWTLIVVVGVLFGMGGSMQVFFERSSGPIHGVSEREIEQRRDILQRLSKTLQDNRAVFYSSDPIVQEVRRAMGAGFSGEFISYEIRLALIANKAGCAPTGSTLDAYVNHWLDLDDGGKTNRDMLKEAEGGDHEVHFDDLRTLAADVLAYHEYQDRHVFAPAVPTVVGESVVRLRSDQVKVDTAVLDEAPFIKPIDPKDPRIQETYDRMRRADSFRKPESVALTVAYADMPALIKRATAGITEAQAKAYYEIHKSEPAYAQPKKPAPAPKTPAKPAPAPLGKASATAAAVAPPKVELSGAEPPEPKPFAEVQKQIIEQLAAAKAQEDAKAAIDRLDKAIGDEGLDGQKDPAGFIAAAKAAGLDTIALSVDRPELAKGAQGGATEGPLVLGALGTTPDDAQLFAPDKEPGFTSRPMQVQAAHPTWALVRLESRTAAGYKTLDEVRAQVIADLQRRLAYDAFIAAAKQARADAQKLGAGGLKAYLSSPAGKSWKATVSSSTMGVGETLVPPPEHVDEPAPTDTVVAASLGLGDHAVALVGESSDDKGALPTIKLVQGTGFVANTTQDQPEMKKYYAEGYRGALESFSESLFSPTVERQLR